MMKYILLMAPSEDLLHLEAMSLNCFYGGDILTARLAQDARDIVLQRGCPDLIISDSQLLEESNNSFYSFLKEHGPEVPLVVSSNKLQSVQLEKKYPTASAYIERPFSINAFNKIVKSMTSAPLIIPTYVPVYLSVLEKFVGFGFDLYIKLSELNYVKVVHKEETFTKVDAERLESKGIHQLYINYKDSSEFLGLFEKNLQFILTTQNLSPDEQITFSMDVVENVEKISRQMGWSPEVILQAQKSIHAATKILTKDAKISEMLRKKISSNSSQKYSRHIGLISYLCCAFGQHLGWNKDSAQIKLTLAAMVHDLAVDEKYYENIEEWNRKAADPSNNEPEVIKYRHHPFEASRLIQSLEVVPPDVDQLILQHHEHKDGTGFPRALTSSRIGHLATLFIIVEDFIDFLDEGEHIETKIIDFITWGDSYYDSGHFKKIFSEIKIKLQS